MSRAARPSFSTLVLLCSLAAHGCTTLPTITPGQCGNLVRETGEACDSFPVGAARCRPPGGAQECQLDCSDDSSVCPVGWGCDATNQICRKASESYRDGVTIPGSAFSLRTGDFDGDKIGDLVALEAAGPLGALKMRVHYLGRGTAPQTVALAPTLLSVDIARVSDDDRDDVVYSNLAVGVLLGQVDRTLLSQAYPSYFLPQKQIRLVGPLASHPIQDQTALIVFAADGSGHSDLYFPGASSLVSLAGVSARIEDLAGELVSGDLLTDSGHPCDELSFALRGANVVSVYSICEGSDEQPRLRTRAELTELAFEPGVSAGPLFADVDGDGHLDLLIASGPDTAPQLYVAYGDGVQLSAAQPFTPRVIPLDDTFRLPGMPIAAGDFTGDGLVDLIYPDFVLTSNHTRDRDALIYGLRTGAIGTAWSAAAIADLNGDGHDDVVFAARDRLDLEFWNGASGDQVLPFIITTTRPVDRLAVTDLDGDAISDLIYAETAPAGESHAVSVAFGRSAGPPDSPLPVARVQDLLQLGSFQPNGPNNIGQVFLAYQQTDAHGDRGSALAWLQSAGDRNLLSPFQLTTFASEAEFEQAASLALVTGRFSDPDPASQRRDLIALAVTVPPIGAPVFSSEKLGLWLVPDLRSGRTQPTRLGWGFDPRLQPFSGSAHPAPSLGLYPTLNLLLAAGDLYGDQRDELIVAASNQAGDACLVATAALNITATPVLDTRAPVVIDASCGQLGQLAVRDLDGDNAPDLLLLTGAPETARNLLVLWNDGSGGFSTDQVTTLNGDGENPQAFTLFQRSDERGPRVAYVTESALRLITTTTGQRDLAASAQTLREDLSHATGVIATDLDGDTVMDLAIAADGSIHVLLAELE